MTKDAIKARKIPRDFQSGSSFEVTSGVGQQAVEAESVSQQAWDTTDLGSQHAESGSWINLISLLMVLPSIIFDL